MDPEKPPDTQSTQKTVWTILKKLFDRKGFSFLL
jgi:hypothetical protein